LNDDKINIKRESPLLVKQHIGTACNENVERTDHRQVNQHLRSFLKVLDDLLTIIHLMSLLACREAVPANARRECDIRVYKIFSPSISVGLMASSYALLNASAMAFAVSALMGTY
jgi:hypothetical protein